MTTTSLLAGGHISVGATDIEALRDGRGEFETEAEFYSFWRKYPFKIGRAVQNQLDRLLKDS